jgi:hypothetical protein
MKKVFAFIAIIALMMVSFSCRDNKVEEETVTEETVDTLETVSPDSLYTVE